ncbi:hypothetical protein C5167_035517 [Papaver somniferum]|uniref:Uncharacterized protein n=1 Tax=Papaver somniferum TaxID=3469 RepID=A0A4Y7KKD3_PAPSO|nr:hypothetical protein C5167_035517 [Papaver somniferum]
MTDPEPKVDSDNEYARKKKAAQADTPTSVAPAKIARHLTKQLHY